MTIWGIVENLISDVIFIVLAIIASAIWVSLTNRRKLQLFFHTTDTKRLVVYLSAINVLPFGATGKSGKKLSYQGQAVAYGEMQGANQIKNLFSFIIPKLTEVSQTIGKLFLSDVVVQTTISPSESSFFDSQASFIALGSPAYNSAAASIESLDKNVAKFQYGTKKLSDIEGSPFAPITYSSSDPQAYPEPGTITAAYKEPYIFPSGEYINPDKFSVYSELIHGAFDAKKLKKLLNPQF